MRTALPPGDRELDDEDLEHLYAPPAGRHLRANFVASLDGAIEVEGHSGGLGSDDDRRVFATLRALTDAVLVGAGTVREENYGPARLAAARRERRLARGQGPAPVIAVVSGRAELDPSARLFQAGEEPRPIVLTAAAAPADRRRALAAVADVVVCGDTTVDAGTAVDTLGHLGHQRVLCEGGPTLMSVLLAAGLVDELCLTHAALLAGPGRHQLTAGASWAAPIGATLEGLVTGDGALLARYRIATHHDAAAKERQP